jgi:uncharacterized protein (DUF302 family)
MTVQRLRAALTARGISVLGHVDHAAGARAVGLELPDEQVLIFGNPQAGTPLMQEDPTIGYELPLRMLIWDAGGQTMIGYRPPTELDREYAVPGHAQVLDNMAGLMAQLAGEAAAVD